MVWRGALGSSQNKGADIGRGYLSLLRQDGSVQGRVFPLEPRALKSLLFSDESFCFWVGLTGRKAPSTLLFEVTPCMNEIWNEAEGVFALMVSAVFLEAAPFLLLGSFLSAISEVFLSPERLSRWIPKGQGLQILSGLSGGLMLPACECGIVPVARRFLLKGVPPRMALAYMLSAPIVNPLVLVSTYVAFQGSVSMVFGRLLMAVGCAATTVLLIRNRQEDILSVGRDPQEPRHLPMAPAAASSDTACGCGCVHSSLHQRKGVRVFRHAGAEFIEMSKYLLFGAVASSLFKLYLPSDLLEWVGGSAHLSVALMMGLAIVLSVCSEADAFVAASFWSFNPTAQLAFIVIGPMVDLKLIAAYSSTFDRRTVLILTLVPIILVYGLSAILGSFGGLTP